MMGLGDVASILIPAVKMVRRENPDAEIGVLTFGPGCELMEQVPVIDKIFTVSPEQWPNEIFPAIKSFMTIAGVLVSQGPYDQILNLDTWFMPCLLVQVLKDAGQPVVGNHLHYSCKELIEGIKSGTIKPDYVSSVSKYLKSDFPGMQDWLLHWWKRFPEAGAYPRFYLNHCCGFEGDVDISLDLPEDEAFLAEAKGRKIVAVSCSGRVGAKQYPHAKDLMRLLEEAGYLVWDEFDGSLPMPTTLGRLRVTDLLVTVPTSTQWLAKLMGCPSLVIPGPLNPIVLAPELSVAQTIECQYCFASHTCPKGLDFACMDVAPEKVAEKVRQFFKGGCRL
jgi:ADP-heptose:LPS heptosyltransferase